VDISDSDSVEQFVDSPLDKQLAATSCHPPNRTAETTVNVGVLSLWRGHEVVTVRSHIRQAVREMPFGVGGVHPVGSVC
jgi:hypothetical protein